MSTRGCVWPFRRLKHILKNNGNGLDTLVVHRVDNDYTMNIFPDSSSCVLGGVFCIFSVLSNT